MPDPPPPPPTVAGCRSVRRAGCSASTPTRCAAGPTRAGSRPHDARRASPVRPAGPRAPRRGTRRHGRARPAARPAWGPTPERLTRVYRRSYRAATRPRRPRRPAAGRRRRARGLPPATAGGWSTALVAYLDADPSTPSGAHDAEAEATTLVDDLARRLAAAGTSLTEAVALFVAARRPFLDRAGRARPAAGARSGAGWRPVRGRVGAARPAAAAVHRDPPGARRADRWTPRVVAARP